MLSWLLTGREHACERTTACYLQHTPSVGPCALCVRPTWEIALPDVGVATRGEQLIELRVDAHRLPAIVHLCLVRRSPWTRRFLEFCDTSLTERNLAAQRSRTSRSSCCNLGTVVRLFIFVYNYTGLEETLIQSASSFLMLE